ncbi:hypothetical protein DET1167 [Dehalococcoides mccartyi 195]|uniref:Uncharacterized protein n=1 Tax=Dehalococcoides mccartyi (strain ATCC BAA-2266 / KCTC 15142 / 195) TaxID=243164 RepID=Q3Z7B8_DEHM1|nr:hypothetical protein DET1167 [Dehalococcoides mccartyi 195]
MNKKLDTLNCRELRVGIINKRIQILPANTNITRNVLETGKKAGENPEQ